MNCEKIYTEKKCTTYLHVRQPQPTSGNLRQPQTTSGPQEPPGNLRHPQATSDNLKQPQALRHPQATSGNPQAPPGNLRQPQATLSVKHSLHKATQCRYNTETMFYSCAVLDMCVTDATAWCNISYILGQGHPCYIVGQGHWGKDTGARTPMLYSGARTLGQGHPCYIVGQGHWGKDTGARTPMH